jgi:YD repeat-containing protein
VLPGGRVVQFGYDSSGNLTSLTPPSRPAHAFAYTTIDLDSVYTPPSAGAGNWATQYRYTLDRELRAIVRPAGDSIALAYETATGRLSTVTFDRGTLSYGYTHHRHPKHITAPGEQRCRSLRRPAHERDMGGRGGGSVGSRTQRLPRDADGQWQQRQLRLRRDGCLTSAGASA